MPPLQTAVIGYGLSAKIFHLPFILSLPELFTFYGIVQRHPTAENDAAADHVGIKSFRSTAEMLKDSAIDVVVVTSIPSTHFDIVKDALEAGKHVLCEKPFVATSKEARALDQIAKENNKVLAVYQNRRWDADFVNLQSLVNQGTLGRIVEVESHFDRHRPEAPEASTASWKAKKEPGNGAIYDLGTHLLDQLVTLLGMPEKITGLISNQRVYGPGTAGADAGGDSFTVLLHYPSKGILATAKAAVVSPETQQLRFWVRGEKGSYKKYNLDPQEDQLKLGMRPVGYQGPGGAPSAEYGVDKTPGVMTIVHPDDGKMYPKEFEAQHPPKTYVEFYKQLAAAIQGSGVVPVTAEEAANVLHVIELAMESSEKGITITL